MNEVSLARDANAVASVNASYYFVVETAQCKRSSKRKNYYYVVENAQCNYKASSRYSKKCQH